MLLYITNYVYLIVDFNMELRLKIGVPPPKANFLNLIVNKYRKVKVKRFFFKI